MGDQWSPKMEFRIQNLEFRVQNLEILFSVSTSKNYEQLYELVVSFNSQFFFNKKVPLKQKMFCLCKNPLLLRKFTLAPYFLFDSSFLLIYINSQNIATKRYVGKPVFFYQLTFLCLIQKTQILLNILTKFLILTTLTKFTVRRLNFSISFHLFYCLIHAIIIYHTEAGLVKIFDNFFQNW